MKQNGSNDASHAVPLEELLRDLGSDPHRGIEAKRALELIAVHGYNELAEKPPTPWWKILAAQFNDVVIWLLLGAAAVSGVLGDWMDGVVIAAIVALNGVIGFVQEDRAGRALVALQKLSSPQAKVIRGGELRVVPSRELVPGDRVEVEAGDQIPADIRLVHSASLRVQEAALTGESAPLEKHHAAVLHEETPLAERKNMAFMGTAVAAGTAGGVVVATGMRTQLGQIAGMLQCERPSATPLQRRLAGVGKILAGVVLGIVAVIFVLQVMRGGRPLDVFLMAVSLAVAAVPEGMPAVVTIALALGLQRMVRRNALIRKLPSVETLGSVTVICSDKTGTLTRNEMTVREVWVASGRIDVGGVGYEPKGGFLRKDKTGEREVSARDDVELMQAMKVAAWCNHARIVAPNGKEDAWRAVGDPTEAALIVAAMKAGVEGANDEHELVAEVPFDSDRKMMSVVAREAEGELVMYTKGALEVVLKGCSHEMLGQPVEMKEERRRDILRTGEALAGRALRVLGLAYGEKREGDMKEEGLVFAGLVGMIDPPREEAKLAVAKCRRAGIRPVMITGDHPTTAIRIAQELGIAGEGDEVMSGVELDRVSDEELAARVEKVAVFARVTAQHKLRVVAALKARDQIVAMTGDGVNDAPAVKAADIGIAMGSGTDVTKEASDMVLMDDNFASIVAAVEEGRGIYDNIRKFIHYLLSSNTSEILVMFCAAVVGWPTPLVAIQILWINLITDSLPALALGVEPTEGEVMARPPRPVNEGVITWRGGTVMVLFGTMMAVVGLVAFVWVYRGNDARLGEARTMTFCTLAMTQLFFSVSCRSWSKTLLELGPWSNRYLTGAMMLGVGLQAAIVMFPWTRGVFKLTSLSGAQWGLALVLSLIPVTVIEVGKLFVAWRKPNRSAAGEIANG